MGGSYTRRIIDLGQGIFCLAGHWAIDCMKTQYRKDDLSVSEEVLNETRRGSTVRESCLRLRWQGMPLGTGALSVTSATGPNKLFFIGDHRTALPGLHRPSGAQGRVLPAYVQREFDDYLKCGRLENGFLWVRCESCHAEHLGACPRIGNLLRKS